MVYFIIIPIEFGFSTDILELTNKKSKQMFEFLVIVPFLFFIFDILMKFNTSYYE